MTSDQQVQPAAATSSAPGAATSRHVHDISWLLDRRSAAVRRLGGPGPSEPELTQILTAALTAPDHGALRPWRIIQCTEAGRVALAELFVAAKLQQKPDAGEAELAREREKALRPPVLLGFLAKPRTDRSEITEPEQIACAGAAMQSILLAAFGLGYGAIILSGSRCTDPGVRQAMGAKDGDHLLGFISIGTIIDTPIPSRRPSLDDMLQIFDGDLAVKE